MSVYRNDFDQTGVVLMRFSALPKKIEMVHEAVLSSPSPTDIVEELSLILSKSIITKDAIWVGRTKLYQNMVSDKGYEEVNMYRKAGIKLKFNTYDDDMTNLIFMNTLFAEKRITVSYACQELSVQLASLELSGSKIDQRFTLVHAILQCIGLLKQTEKLQISKVYNQGYGKKEVVTEDLVKRVTMENLAKM